MARRRSGALRSAAGRGATIRASGVGPMQFGRSTIGWGASASPAAYAMGRAYGSIPRSAASGTSGAGLRRILNPWGNNYPKPSAMGANSIGQTRARNSNIRGGRRAPTQSSDELRMIYPANDPRLWPIAGGKRIVMFQAAKANFWNTAVDRAFMRGGYELQQSYPIFTGTDQQYADQQVWSVPW